MKKPFLAQGNDRRLLSLLLVYGLGHSDVMATISSTENIALPTIAIAYIKQPEPLVQRLSSRPLRAKDSGEQGALLGLNDANTTGKFLNARLTLSRDSVDSTAQLLSLLKQYRDQGTAHFLLNVPHQTLLAAQQWAMLNNATLFNVARHHDALRQQRCSEATFHTIPSYAMKADALAQWLLMKRLTKVLVIVGDKTKDQQIVSAFNRAAKRYGLTILEQKKWDFNADLRRSAGAEMPLFTQTSRDYDVVFVADDAQDFAPYIPYNTFLPRPVVGSAGLEALSWHANIEQWGATQLQNRFNKRANRAMNEVDFAAYLAIRSIAVAFFALKSDDHHALRDYLRSGGFSLAAYLGRKLTFRPWSGQLRMPIALVHPQALISQSPQFGILHPTNELDSLGFDHQNSRCHLNKTL